MPEVRFVGDAHLGHAKVAGVRGFATAEAHDQAVLRALHKVARPDTIWWWLGDVAFNGWRDRIGVIRSIPGVHHLVLGNHDRAFPAHSQAHNYIADYMTVFASVQLAARLSYDGQGLLLSHFPLSGDHTETDRYEQWRLPDLGKPVIHGHTHSTERLSRSPKGTLQIHAGLDAWGLKPPTLAQLMTEAGAAKRVLGSSAGDPT